MELFCLLARMNALSSKAWVLSIHVVLLSEVEVLGVFVFLHFDICNNLFILLF